MCFASLAHGKYSRQKEETAMALERYRAPVHFRIAGIASVLFGILGFAFYWWTPMGMVFSLTGIIMGFAGWLNTRMRLKGFSVPVAGMLISVAALVLDGVIAGLGMEIVKFGPLRR
jgi:hypothetical protein